VGVPENIKKGGKQARNQGKNDLVEGGGAGDIHPLTYRKRRTGDGGGLH
jgi:hypothetical protein